MLEVEEVAADVVKGEAALNQDDFLDVRRELPALQFAYAPIVSWSAGVMAFNAVVGTPPVSNLIRIGLLSAFLLGTQAWRRNRWLVQTAGSLGGTPRSYAFDAQALTIDSPGSSSRTEFSKLIAKLETPACFVLWPSSQTFVIIPKRAFQPESLGAIRERLQPVKRLQTDPGQLLRRRALAFTLALAAVMAFIGSVTHHGKRRHAGHAAAVVSAR